MPTIRRRLYIGIAGLLVMGAIGYSAGSSSNRATLGLSSPVGSSTAAFETAPPVEPPTPGPGTPVATAKTTSVYLPSVHGSVVRTAPTDSEVIKLSPPLPPEGSVINTRHSPAGDYVVFTTRSDKFEMDSIYSAPVNGGPQIKLNEAFPAASIGMFDISPDGQYVVFAGDPAYNRNSGPRRNLYSIPIAGGQLTQLNVALPNSEVSEFQISPDGRWVVFMASQPGTNGTAMTHGYSIPITGSVPNTISDSSGSCGWISAYEISHNSRWIVYDSAQHLSSTSALCSVPIEGGTSIDLTSSLSSGANQRFFQYWISPDSRNVVFTADQEGDHIVEFYQEPIGGGSVLRLSEQSDNQHPGRIMSLDFGLDGTRVVYLVMHGPDSLTELWSMPLDGSPGIRLNEVLPKGNVEGFRITEDGQHLLCYVFLPDHHRELYRVPIGGGAATKLSPDVAPNMKLSYFTISADNQYLIYSVVSQTPPQLEPYVPPEQRPEREQLWSAPLAGGEPVQLNARIPPNGKLARFSVSPDSRWVLYQASQQAVYAEEIYAVAITGGTPVKVNAPLVAGGNVSSFYIMPDSSRVVYNADQEIDNHFELYVSSRVPK